MTTKPLNLVLLWHMHQPDFRDPASGEYLKPWVYLHALKDYSDMVAHLERHPQMRAVVNLVPVLLEQIEDYASQLREGTLRDPLLRLLASPSLEGLADAQRTLILEQCFLANHAKMLDPFAPYRRLRDLAQGVAGLGHGAQRYLSAQYLADLLTWYHLAWTGETVRRDEVEVARLMAKGEGFTLADREGLLGVIGRVLDTLVARYRALADRGQLELCCTPYYHPIGPLLLDLGCVREAQPEAPRPAAPEYPGGHDRVGLHLRWAQESHTARFGVAPVGMWPAEGALSTDFAALLERGGVRWTASGEAVLMNALHSAGHEPNRDRDLYRGWTLSGSPGLRCFFRDDRLSDLIGFEYKDWFGTDAAIHLVTQLTDIAERAPEGVTPTVSLILDGENAWEHYPYNGYYFLNELYQRLGAQAAITTCTFAELLDPEARPGQAPPGVLPRLVAGSWVHGTLATWAGSPDKNRAWDLLVAAKQAYDRAAGRLGPAKALRASRQLGACEGSDWFWWFGDYNPGPSVEAFDRLFRTNLARLYELLEVPPPAELDEPVSRGGGMAEGGGAMRRAT